MDSYVSTREPESCPHCGGRLGADGRAHRPGDYVTTSAAKTSLTHETPSPQETSFHD
jgi:hypothetical protein